MRDSGLNDKEYKKSMKMYQDKMEKNKCLEQEEAKIKFLHERFQKSVVQKRTFWQKICDFFRVNR